MGSSDTTLPQSGDTWERDGMIHYVLEQELTSTGGTVIRVLRAADREVLERQLEAIKQASDGKEETS